MKTTLHCPLFSACLPFLAAKGPDPGPDILWILVEDWSRCGTKGIHTPNADMLTAEGIRYQRAFSANQKKRAA